MANLRKMLSKFKGTCTACKGSIRKGERIAWSRETGAMHESCAPSGDSRADAEYQAGVADANRYLNDKAIYGEALAEQWEMEAEMARYNRGEDY